MQVQKPEDEFSAFPTLLIFNSIKIPVNSIRLADQ